MVSKNKFLIAGILLCIGILMVSLVINKKSPYEYLQKHDGTTQGTVASEFLHQEKIGEGQYAVFFLNGNGNVSCAIIKKTLLSYHLLEISAEVSLSNKETGNYLYSSYKDGNTRRWIDWGIIQSESIKSVLTDGQEGTLIEIQPYNFRIYYLMGEGNKTNAPSHVEVK